MQILRKQVDFAVGQSLTDIGGNGLCALVLYLVFYPVANKFWLTLWLITIFLMVISRTVIGFKRIRQHLKIDSAILIYKLYVPHIVLLGTMWGSSVFICFNATQEVGYKFFLVVELAGVAAGAASSLPVFWKVYLAFLYQIMVPIAIMLFLENDRLSLYLAMLTVLFIGYLTISSKRTHSIISEALTARFQIEEMARIDVLTKVANRRSFNEAISKEAKRANRKKTPLSLILIDVDFFKKVNDIQGHLIGDKVLEEIANILKNSVFRPADMIARYGGEEFVALLPETNEKDAKMIAERIRGAVKNKHIPHPDSACGDWITISAGVTTVYPDNNCETSPNSIIELADKALYKAKHSGRNCVC